MKVNHVIFVFFPLFIGQATLTHSIEYIESEPAGGHSWDQWQKAQKKSIATWEEHKNQDWQKYQNMKPEDIKQENDNLEFEKNYLQREKKILEEDLKTGTLTQENAAYYKDLADYRLKQIDTSQGVLLAVKGLHFEELSEEDLERTKNNVSNQIKRHKKSFEQDTQKLQKRLDETLAPIRAGLQEALEPKAEPLEKDLVTTQMVNSLMSELPQPQTLVPLTNVPQKSASLQSAWQKGEIPKDTSKILKTIGAVRDPNISVKNTLDELAKLVEPPDQLNTLKEQRDDLNQALEEHEKRTTSKEPITQPDKPKTKLQKLGEFFKDAVDAFVDGLKQLQRAFRSAGTNRQEARADLFKAIGLEQESWDDKNAIRIVLKKALEDPKKSVQVQVFNAILTKYTEEQPDIKNQVREKINQLITQGTNTVALIDTLTAVAIQEVSIENIGDIAYERAYTVQELNKELNDLPDRIKRELGPDDPIWDYLESELKDDTNQFIEDTISLLTDRQLIFEKNYQTTLENMKAKFDAMHEYTKKLTELSKLPEQTKPENLKENLITLPESLQTFKEMVSSLHAEIIKEITVDEKKALIKKINNLKKNLGLGETDRLGKLVTELHNNMGLLEDRLKAPSFKLQFDEYKKTFEDVDPTTLYEKVNIMTANPEKLSQEDINKAFELEPIKTQAREEKGLIRDIQSILHSPIEREIYNAFLKDYRALQEAKVLEDLNSEAAKNILKEGAIEKLKLTPDQISALENARNITVGSLDPEEHLVSMAAALDEFLR